MVFVCIGDGQCRQKQGKTPLLLLLKWLELA